MYSLHLLGRKVDVAQRSLQIDVYYTRFEVPAAMIMKITVFCASGTASHPRRQ
jgi:hypothetical protein